MQCSVDIIPVVYAFLDDLLYILWINFLVRHVVCTPAALYDCHVKRVEDVRARKRVGLNHAAHKKIAFFGGSAQRPQENFQLAF